MTDARSQRRRKPAMPETGASGTAPAQASSIGVSGTSAMPGGRRRIDRVLAEDFADHLEDLPMDELRSRRKDAEQEETDLSYLRRLIQGRADIVQAEIERRGGAEKKDLVEQLTGILAEGNSRQPHGSGRFMTVEPSRMDERRRRVEKVLADVDISNANARSDDELLRRHRQAARDGGRGLQGPPAGAARHGRLHRRDRAPLPRRHRPRRGPAAAALTIASRSSSA